MQKEFKVTTETKYTPLDTLEYETLKEKLLKLKEKYPKLTEEDLELEEGKFEEFIDKIHAKIGKVFEKSKEGLHKFIDSL